MPVRPDVIVRMLVFMYRNNADSIISPIYMLNPMLSNNLRNYRR